MSDDTFDLYLVSSPDSVTDQAEELNGARSYLWDLLRAYDGIPVTDIADFVTRVAQESVRRGKKVRKIVLGAHGNGWLSDIGTYGTFHIGKTMVGFDHDILEVNKLASIKPYLAQNARVYILACKVGNNTGLLGQISNVLGGIPVYGFTNFITATNYGPFGVSVDDGVGDSIDDKHDPNNLIGKEIACFSSFCISVGEDGEALPPRPAIEYSAPTD